MHSYFKGIGPKITDGSLLTLLLEGVFFTHIFDTGGRVDSIHPLFTYIGGTVSFITGENIGKA